MSIPKHIAIIMDGNRRWAKKHLFNKYKGHQKGVLTVREIVKHCNTLGVSALTLFAFSSENKNRSTEEISALFKLFLNSIKKETKKLNKYNIKLKVIGDLSLFSTKIQLLVSQSQKLLSQNSGLILIIAANYGGQWDIINSAKQIANLCMQGKINVKDIDKDIFCENLSLAGMPAVDLLIRTSGEVRISNFLLWDIAYSELYFTDVLWPDFNTYELDKAIETFNKRERRFGVRKNN